MRLDKFFVRQIRVQLHREHAGAALHGVQRVGAQIHRHLINLCRIGQNGGSFCGQLHLDFDLCRQRGAEKLCGFLDGRIQPDDLALLLAPAAEGQNLLHEIFCPAGGVEDFRDVSCAAGLPSVSCRADCRNRRWRPEYC